MPEWVVVVGTVEVLSWALRVLSELQSKVSGWEWDMLGEEAKRAAMKLAFGTVEE